MHQLLKQLIETGQTQKTISSGMTADETVHYLFIAARGLVFDRCLNEGDYNLEDAAESYFARLIRVFA